MSSEISNIAELKSISEDFPKIVKAISNFKHFEKDTKYTYDHDSMTFSPSGGYVTTISEGLLGEWGKWTVQSVSRAVFGGDFEEMAQGLDHIKTETDLLVGKISRVAFKRWMDCVTRAPLIEMLSQINCALVLASPGLDRVIATYKTDRIKARVINPACNQFSTLQAAVQGLTQEMLTKNNIEADDERFSHRQKMACREKDPTLGRRYFSDVAVNLTAKNLWGISGGSEKLLPEDLNHLVYADIVTFLKKYQMELDKMIDENLKISEEFDYLILRREQIGLYRTLQYFKDKTFIHLKEDTGIPGIKRVLRIQGETRTVFFTLRRKMADKAAIDRIENNERLMKKYQDCRGFIKPERVTTYLSKPKKKDEGQASSKKIAEDKDNEVQIHSILIRDYNLGSLSQALKNKKVNFTFNEKCQLALDLLFAIEKLHQDHYVHLNLKPDVILVEKLFSLEDKKTYAASLFGFDFTKKYPSDNSYHMPFTDIWLLSHVFEYLFQGNQTEFLRSMKRSTIFEMDLATAMHPKYQQKEPKPQTIDYLIWQMRQSNPAKRPSASEAIEFIENLLQFEKMKEDLESATQVLTGIEL